MTGHRDHEAVDVAAAAAAGHPPAAADAEPGAAQPGATGSGDAESGDAVSGDAQPGDVDPGEVGPGEGAPGGGEDPGPAAEDEPVADEDEADPVEVLAAERDEYLDLLRRERAEFENFRRRANRERAEALDRGAQQVVASLLGVLDNFGFVLAAAADSEDGGLRKGVEMVHDELWRALADAGLEQVPGAGAPFDPVHHEAMLQATPDAPVDEPTVVEVLREGYRFKGRVLRAASVSVAQPEEGD